KNTLISSRYGVAWKETCQPSNRDRLSTPIGTLMSVSMRRLNGRKCTDDWNRFPEDRHEKRLNLASISLPAPGRQVDSGPRLPRHLPLPLQADVTMTARS